MQWASGAGGNGLIDRMPAALTTSTSPGSTSRTYVAPMRSSAQVSEHTTTASPRRPSASGRNPCGSLTAIIRSRVRRISENAPCACDTESTTAASTFGAFDRAYRCSTTSVSLFDWKIDPWRTSSSRNSPALTRLPLWQIAIWPCAQSMRIGCAFDSLLSPAVE